MSPDAPRANSARDDPSNGYERVAAEFIGRRRQSRIGAATVRMWARSLSRGGSVLDLGCGSGVPVSEILIDEGLAVYGVDASPSMIEVFRRRFPHAHVACEAVEDSRFFGRMFDGAVAVGLLFLLSAEAQRDVIRRVAFALNPRGRFLFTSPSHSCAWHDNLTGRLSQSLGADSYKTIAAEAGLTMVDEYTDEGGNHYYDACRTRVP